MEIKLDNDHKTGFFKSNLAFLTQFLRNPKEIGAIVPSSDRLGRAMAAFVPEDEERFVVELGPGTGPITKALLQNGLTEKNLICLEQSERMVAHLKNRFPNLNIIQGDACELSNLLKDKAGKVNAIVSSLPLKSIPSEIVTKIIDQIYTSLADDGVVIQFTYDLRPKKSPYVKKFTRLKHKLVLRNIPPARVDVFLKNK